MKCLLVVLLVATVLRTDFIASAFVAPSDVLPEVSDVEGGEQQVQQLPFDLPLVLTPLDDQSDVYVVEQPEDTAADVPIDKRDVTKFKIKIRKLPGKRTKTKVTYVKITGKK
jgi:hypothetical protein